jgi:hypothetical protein
MFPENYLQHYVVCIPISIIVLSFISMDCMSLQTRYRIFFGRLARIREPTFRSAHSDIHIDFIYLTHHTSLLSLVVISLLVIAIQLNYGHSKRRVNLTDRSVHESQKV